MLAQTASVSVRPFVCSKVNLSPRYLVATFFRSVCLSVSMCVFSPAEYLSFFSSSQFYIPFFPNMSSFSFLPHLFLSSIKYSVVPILLFHVFANLFFLARQT